MDQTNKPDGYNERFMELAVNLALNGSQNGHGGPFGAVVVRNGEIIGEGFNRVTSSNDPTAHAEVVAIRMACEKLKSFQLEGCDIYCSCEPCPMCLGAIYWARPARVFYASTKSDAADAGFDDQFIYDELSVPAENRKIPMFYIKEDKATDAFGKWKVNPFKVKY
jgi:guanine deaminase